MSVRSIFPHPHSAGCGWGGLFSPLAFLPSIAAAESEEESTGVNYLVSFADEGALQTALLLSGATLNDGTIGVTLSSGSTVPRDAPAWQNKAVRMPVFFVDQLL